jgi:protocatechuate 3,4-dioxygenase beta subunit
MTQAVSIERRVSKLAVVLILATMTLAAIPMPSADAQNLPASLYTVEGYVYDNQANPLAEASVVVYPAGGGNPTTATTDAAGKYSIGSLAAGKYNATASAAGLVASFVPIQVGGTDSRIQQSFLLSAPDQQVYGQPLALKGVIKDDASGAPVADASIEIWNYYYPRDGYAYGGVPSNSEQRQTLRSAADGTYSAVVSEGSINMMVRKDGFDVLHANFEMHADRVLDLPMMKGSSQSILISGTVLSVDGKPLVDAWVNVQPDYRCDGGDPNMGCAYPAYDSGVSKSSPEGDVYFYYEPSVSPYNSTMTDKSGKYSLRTMPGRILVTAQANDHLQKMEGIQASSGEQKTVDFELEKIPADSVRIHGRVVDASTGKGISYAQLNLENLKWGHYNYTQTGKDGSYEFWTKPGYTIVTASAYQWYYAPCGSVESSPSSTWVDPSASDSAGVAAPEPYYSPAPCDSGERDREYMTRVLTITGSEGQPQDLEFKLIPRPVPDAVFQGYVVNQSSDKGVPHAQVSFYNELTRDYGQAVTDEDGSYKIKVHGGYYTIRVYVEHYFDVAQNAEIKSGETQRLDLFATPGERTSGYCCYQTYASADGYATKEMTHSASGGMGAPAMAPVMSSSASYDESSARAGADASGGGRQAYLGEGGGLGPYSPAGESDPGGKAPGASLVVVLVAALGAILLARRRN